MMNNLLVPFEELVNADLKLNHIYKGGNVNNLSSEPISKILPVGNQGGIRFSGTITKPRLIVLYSTFTDKDWPDCINGNLVTYYGDNKIPGREIHEVQGNKLFRSLFDNLHLGNKVDIPPIFLFSKGKNGFDRVFKGILVPGSGEHKETEDLVAIWKTKNNMRFQNYKAIFTILPEKLIAREWIVDIMNNKLITNNTPISWKAWIN